MTSSSTVLLNTLRLFPDELQALRVEITQIQTEFGERMSQCQNKVDNLFQRVQVAVMAMTAGDNSKHLDNHGQEKAELGGDEKPMPREDATIATSQLLDMKDEAEHASSFHGWESKRNEKESEEPRNTSVPTVLATFAKPTFLKTPCHDDVIDCEDGSVRVYVTEDFIKRNKMSGTFANDEKLPKTPDFKNSSVFHGIEKINKHGRTGTKRVYHCHCGQMIEFSYRKMIEHYMDRTVENFEEKFRCRLCGFKCSSSFNLQVHSKRTHQHKILKCGICFQEMDSDVSHYVHLYTDQTECGKFVAEKKANGEPWMFYLLI